VGLIYDCMDADWWFLVLSFPPVLHWWKTDILIKLLGVSNITESRETLKI